jgi:hypothetical protein
LSELAYIVKNHLLNHNRSGLSFRFSSSILSSLGLKTLIGLLQFCENCLFESIISEVYYQNSFEKVSKICIKDVQAVRNIDHFDSDAILAGHIWQESLRS